MSDIPLPDRIAVFGLETDTKGIHVLDADRSIYSSSIEEMVSILRTLNIESHHSVLQIGFGCGYWTAVLAGMTLGPIFATESHRPMFEKGYRNLEKYFELDPMAEVETDFLVLPRLRASHILLANMASIAGRDPLYFDRIVSHCAFPSIPRWIFKLLKPSAVAIIPQILRATNDPFICRARVSLIRGMEDGFYIIDLPSLPICYVAQEKVS